jgi:hypothetical protein
VKEPLPFVTEEEIIRDPPTQTELKFGVILTNASWYTTTLLTTEV